jgi:allantoinase
VVNLEYWRFDAPTPRTIVTPPHNRANIPDLPNFCWAEYGVRCGMPRLMSLFEERALPVTASVNASAIDIYPPVVERMLKAGWEFIGHGIQQMALHEEADEGAAIKAALAKLRGFTGKKPRGWMSPGWTETFDTADLLRANGVDYVCQWVIDDVPTWLETKHGSLLAVPYALDLNDSVVFAIEKHSSGEMAARISETIRTFEYEIAQTGQVRVLTIPLHPHLSGVPHRINYLTGVVDALLARTDTIVMTGGQIFDWYVGAGTSPPAERSAPTSNR